MGRGRRSVAVRPLRSAPEAVWLGVGQRWHLQKLDYRERLARLVKRMREPGGTSCGKRWLPLAYWVGWSRGLGSWLTYIMDRESSGRPRAYNPVISCTGLMQLWPGNVAYTGLPWSGRIRWLMDPENNLRAALRLYRECGANPWHL
jgi:hypothetical protein